MIDALNSAISYPKDVSTVDMDYLLSMLADPNSPSSTTFSFGTHRLYFPSRTDVEDTNSLLNGWYEREAWKAYRDSSLGALPSLEGK